VVQYPLIQFIKEIANLKKILQLTITALLLCQLTLPLQARTAISKTVGKFDYYTLALSWHPAFCESKPNKSECKSQHEKRFYASNFVLHGLWPNVKGDKRHTYGYCNVPKNIARKGRRRCNMPKLDLSVEVRNSLNKFMPATVSCLQRHEWYKHGSCSGLSENDYYALSNRLVEMFSKTRFSQYVANNVGKFVKRKKLLKKFDQEFGKGSNAYLALKCNKVRGTSLLTELQIHLNKNISRGRGFKDLFPKRRFRVRGSCPRRFKIDKVGIGK